MCVCVCVCEGFVVLDLVVQCYIKHAVTDKRMDRDAKLVMVVGKREKKKNEKIK